MMRTFCHRLVRWRFLGFSLILGFAALNASAQVTPTINKLSDINVGGIVPGAAAGTATLNSPSGTRTAGGATSLGSSVGLSLGTLTLTGRPGDGWSITGASAIPFTLTGPGTLQATTVDFEPSTTNTGTFPASGTTSNFYLGVALNVGTAATAPPGIYTGSVSLLLTDTTTGRTSTRAFTVTARVEAVITLTKITNLNFGDVYTTTTSGTVLLSPVGVRTITGGVILGNLSPVSAASFTVTGTASVTYAITLPVSIVLTGPSGTMTVNTFTSNPSGTGNLSTSGQQQLNVGAKLNVAANQASGNYSGIFSVTVAYN